MQGICRGWAAGVKRIGDSGGRMAFFRDELSAFLVNRTLFEGLLKAITNGDPHPDLRQETQFDNELVLHRDPGRLFSVRMYIFGPGAHTSVHDHSSWGVSGSAFGPLEVVRYRREDSGADPGQAQLALLNAQSALEQAQEDRTRMDYARCAESTLDDYQSQYYSLLDQYNDLLDRLEDVIATRDEDDPIRLAMEAQVESLEEQVQAALINVNWCNSPYTEEEKAEGDAQVALAQAELIAAQAEVDSWLNYPDPLDVAVAEAQVTSAEAALADAQETQLIVDLVAPIGGTVLNINGTVGEDVGTSALITIADLSQPMLQVYLDETDFDKAIVGYAADVSFDAYPDELFTGKVVQVDPSLSSSMGASLVSLLVQLDPLTLDQPQRLPLGMSATVDVIAGRATNAVLVPVEAVRDLGDGTYAVFVVENGQPVLRVVTIGITDLTYVEITSGLNAGETVTTGIVETN